MNTQLVHPDPIFRPLQTTTTTSYTPDVLSLHKLGWSVSNIARHLSILLDKPIHRTRFMVNATLSSHDISPMSLSKLLSHIEFNKLIDPEYLDDFINNAKAIARTESPDAVRIGSLNQNEIYLIKVLAMLSWKKKRIAKLFRISPTLVSMYTLDLEPWSYEELTELISFIN